MRHLFRVVQTLEVTGPVNRNLVTCPITIEEADIPPLLRNTERLGAAGQYVIHMVLQMNT